MDVNVNGVLYTAQAAGRQMRRFGSGGSIILIASMSGSIANQASQHTSLRLPELLAFERRQHPFQDHSWVAYNTSKSAVLQLARSMACELGKERIRVNTLSPGYIYTKCAVS